MKQPRTNKLPIATIIVVLHLAQSKSVISDDPQQISSNNGLHLFFISFSMRLITGSYLSEDSEISIILQYINLYQIEYSQQNYSMKRGSFNYSELINFEDKQQLNPQVLWAEPKNMSKQNSFNYIMIKQVAEPTLLQSAVTRVRYNRQKIQSDAISDLDSMYSSNYCLTRQNTPATLKIKKKNRHRTNASDLFDIQSQNQAHIDQENQLQGLIVSPHYIGLSDLVYLETIGKQRKINPKLMHSWKDCLMHQDKTQIYGQSAAYSFSRNFPINQLERGFNEIYGSGKKRCLTLGQQSSLICEMQRYLERCSKQYNKIGRRDYDILTNILSNAKLQQLQNYPVCMRQAELIWRILATFWRYSGELKLENNRVLESALINGRSNFIDLSKDTPVTRYILKNSNIQELINH